MTYVSNVRHITLLEAGEAVVADAIEATEMRHSD